MPISTLINAVMHWASNVFSTKEATAGVKATADAAQAMADVTVVTLTEAEDGTVTADMTIDEVAELVRGGRRVVAVVPSGHNVQLTQVGTTRQGKNTVFGALLYNGTVINVDGTVYSSGDTWTVNETTVNTAAVTYVGDFNIQVDASNGAIKTAGPHSDGTIRSRTMALATDLTSLTTRVDALEGAGGGGAGGPFVVRFTAVGETITADKTYEEVAAAFQSHVGVIGILSFMITSDVYLDFQTCCPSANIATGGIDFVVITYADNNSKFVLYRVALAQDSTVTITTFNITPDA